MKQGVIRLVIIFMVFAWVKTAQAQERKYSIYWERRASLFENLPTSKKDIIFLGNSITDGAEWAELFDNPRVKNRGISGDITSGILDRLDPIVKGKPAKLFLLIGINDVSRGISVDSIVGNIRLILERIQLESPKTRIYLQSVLPVNDAFDNFKKHASRWAMVPEINVELKKLASEKQLIYIDLFSHFTDASGAKLNPDYTNDGLHLMGEGYLKWKKLIESHVNK
ncbi:GDSL-type esterase/lipase family protein [Sunxiuqinia elliptica]|uniref:Lysophospholipase L1 n=1 Tax=Sunxiuqinia elliptica TaxID=655355 RepID=A0A1I2I2S5_9BACT|nr:GDSL-type esterase/lipase family protein [Sunxiuqinia elliptica]SFF35206.1 Lysophospholipase L1 [Sunxiuqinia elliptica]